MGWPHAPRSLGTSVGEGLRCCTVFVVVPVSTGCFSPGVTLLPAPKSRLCPEPAPAPGQGTPCQRLPPAPGCGRQVGRGPAHPRHAREGCFGVLSHVRRLGAAGGPITWSPAASQGPCSPRLPSPRRKGGSGPRRSLSVEDIGAPGRLRAVGRVVEVFPDGTSQLELQRPPHGAFGFSVTSGHGRPDTGMVGSSQSVTRTLGGGTARHGPSAVALVPPQERAWGRVEGAAPSPLSPKGVMVDGGMPPRVALATHSPMCPSALGLGHAAHPKGHL